MTISALRRLSFIVVCLATLAAACGSADSNDTATAADPDSPQTSIPAAAPESTPAAAPVERSSEPPGELLPADGPGGELEGIVSSITEPWPTDWTRRTIALDELHAGLQYFDPRDGIPPIDDPTYKTVDESTWLGPNEPGAVVRIDGNSWFFPLSIMTRHEIVNDELGGVPVAVTYCPLCNTAIAYDRRVDGQVLRFGVSGLLRQSDLVMWDDLTTSLWQQITGDGLVGTYAGFSLEPISTAIVSFEQFSLSAPDGLVLSDDNGFGIEYGRNPYVGYSSQGAPIPSFVDGDPDPRLPALSRVVGVTTDDGDKAYPFDEASAAGVINDSIGSVEVAVFWQEGTADALDQASIAESRQIGSAVAYNRSVAGQTLTFEATDDGFVDSETGTRWSILGIAEEGALAGTELDVVTHRNEFWFAWAFFFPGADVFGLN